MAVVEVKRLKYRYPNMKELALDDINFTVEKGEFIGIIGENGAGKSTLSQALIGLVPQFHKGAYGGQVSVCGANAEKTPVSQLCRQVGLVFQNPFNQLSGAKDSVYEEVAFGMQNLAVPREEMHRRIEEALRLFDIWEYRDRNPFDLSGGQMQRVAIASIYVMQPQIMILDEPTSQLDPQGTEEVFQVVDTLTKSGITIFMIEQKIEKLAAYCDKLLLLHKGRQIVFDTPGRVFSMDNLSEFGIQPPVYTRICIGKKAAQTDGTYPVTVQEAGKILERFRCVPVNTDTEVMSENGKTVFEAQKLDFAYKKGNLVIENLNLSLDGRPTAIIGQNGAGKTTFVRILKGLLKPVAGRILFFGEDIQDRTVAMLASQVGYVFQNPDDQIFKYKVMDEVMFGPLNIGMTADKAQEEARKALELVGLLDKAEDNPYDLELGERKLVAIASVLAMDTQVVILDEPTIAQDYHGRQIIGSIIQKLNSQGKLVIAILHDMDFVAENFSRVIVMTRGKILADGTPGEVYAQNEVLRQARLSLPYVAALCRQMGYRELFLTVEEFMEGTQ